MIEYLGPVISLYKLITDSLKSLYDKGKVKKKKHIQRKIIEIQLSLEDIIDNAQEILSLIKRNAEKKSFSKEEIDVLKRLLYSQRHRLHLLLAHLRDDTSEEIMKLFAPNIRRRIIDLVHIKGGAIEYLIFDLHRSDEKRFPYINSAIYEWNHDRFIEEGSSYAAQILRRTEKRKISIFERIEEQEGIVTGLAECSKELSDFIRSQIDIEDVVLCRGRKGR